MGDTLNEIMSRANDWLDALCKEGPAAYVARAIREQQDACEIRVIELEQGRRDLRELLKAWALGDNDHFAAVALGAFLREFGKAPDLAASGEEQE